MGLFFFKIAAKSISDPINDTMHKIHVILRGSGVSGATIFTKVSAKAPAETWAITTTYVNMNLLTLE